MVKTLRTFLCGLIVMLGLTGSASAEVTTVLSADFSILVKGSPESPVSITSLGSIYDRVFSGYFANKGYEAGGALLIQDGGYMSMPSKNLSANGGVFKVILEVKANDDMGAFTFQAGYSTRVTEYLYDSEWHTVEMMLNGGTSYTSLRLEPFLCASGLLVRKVTIQQSPEFLVAPTAQQPIVATATSFTARWKSVTGATAYFLDVYSYNGDDKEYVIENENVGNVTSKAVSGLDASKTYYYVVRSTNGEAVSDNSNEIRVVPVLTTIATPSNVSVSAEQDGAYTVTWDAVEGAYEYIVAIMRNEITKEDGEAAVLSEDFAGLTAGTITSLEYIYDRHLAVLHAPGWTGYNMACASGIFAFAPYGDGSWVATPELDLTANSGNVKVSLNLGAGNFGSFVTTESVTVQLIEEGDDEDTVISEKTVNINKSGFNRYDVDLTGGTAACKVKVVYGGSQKVYFEDFDVMQVLPAGTEISSQYAEEVSETNSFSGTVPQDGATYSVVITAVGETVSGGEIADIYSEGSDPVEIKSTVGIHNVGIDGAEVSAYVSAPGQITVAAADAVQVSVYDLNGRKLAGSVVSGTATIDLNVHGVVVALVGEKAFKLAL